MKSLLVVLLLYPFLSFARQPRIIFKAPNAKGQAVKISTPVNGNYYMATTRDTLLDSKGQIMLLNREKKPAEFQFTFKRPYRLYVRPGQSYTITVINDSSFTIEAADKEAQVALNRLSFDFYQSVAAEYYKRDTVFSHNKKLIMEEVDRLLLPFTSLQKQGRMDDQFYAYTDRLLKNHYATVLAATMIRPMMSLEFRKDSARYNAEAIRLIDQQWKEILDWVKIDEPASTVTSSYFYYTMFYEQWYLHYFRPNSLQGKMATDSFWDAGGYRLIQETYKEPIKEYLTASWMYFVMAEHEFQPMLLTWYKDFKAAYPNSPYTKWLVSEVSKVRDYQEKIKAGFTAQQHFVEAPSSITSVAQLADRFKGKTVFMDLWATWCGPCKEEFTYNDSLKAFLKNKGIEVLYVSIDKEKADSTWKEMIKYYKLDGYHIRASNQSLVNDIYKVFGTKVGVAIPRYALIKDGKIVLDNAKAPSEKGALYKQLEEYL